jgi:MFS family permease
VFDDVDRRVLVLALARAADSVANSFIIILVPIYIASQSISLAGLTGIEVFGVTLTEQFYIGIVLSLFGLINSFLQPFTGTLSDRVERRRVFVLAGLAIIAVSSALYPFVTTYLGVLAIRGIQGIGAAFTIPATVALVNEFSAGDGRGESFGVFNTLRLVGFGVGPILAGAVYQFGPYQTPVGTVPGLDAAFMVAVVGATLGFGLVTWFVTDPPGVATHEADDDSMETGGFSFLDPAGISRINPVIVLGIGTFLLAGAISMFTPLEGPVTARLNESSFLFSLQFSIGVLATIIFQVPAGRASDIYGRRPTILAGFVVLVPSMIAQGVVTTPIGMFIARFVLGAAFAAVFAPSLALAGDLAGDRSGSTLAILTGAFGLGIALGPISAGFLFSLGSYSTPFFVGGAFAVLATLLVFLEVYEPERIERDLAADD